MRLALLFVAGFTMKIFSFLHASAADTANSAPPTSTSSQLASSRGRPASEGSLGGLLARTRTDVESPIHDPASTSSKGSSRGRRLTQWLGHEKEGVNPLALLTRMPGAYALEAVGNANAGATYTYDGLLPHDILNVAAAGLAVTSASTLRARYRTRLDEMLRSDVDALKRSSAQQQQLRRSGKPSVRPLNSEESARYPQLDAHFRETDASMVDNLIVTRDSRGNWKYDKPKLLKIARNERHPYSMRARDVLTLMHIYHERGTRQRKGAMYQTFMSGLGAGASVLMIAGTHGAALPVVAAGYAVAAGREFLAMGKPFAQERQKMRDAKAEEMTRMVKHDLKTRLANHDFQPFVWDEARRAAVNANAQAPSGVLPETIPLEAKSGIVAAAFENAERKTAERSFGKWIPGRLINHRKSTPAQDEERGIVVKHVLDAIRNELEHMSFVALDGLQDVAHAPNFSLSGRVRRLTAQVKADPRLESIHTILTEMGMRPGEALGVMTQLVDVHLAKLRGFDRTNPLGNETQGIADLINQPQLKREPLETAEASMRDALVRGWISE